MTAGTERLQRSGQDDPPAVAVAGAPDPAQVVAEARVRLRAPWAASIAGLLFAAFFTIGLVLIRNSPLIGFATDSDVARLLGQGEDWWLLVIAGLMAIWLIMRRRAWKKERARRH